MSPLMRDGLQRPHIIVALLVILACITGCTALHPGADEYALTGHMEQARQYQDLAPDGQNPQLRSAWLQWHDGDLLAAVQTMAGQLPADWSRPLANWIGDQAPAEQDSLFALADASLPVSLALTEQWLLVREREHLPLPDSLLLRLSHRPQLRFRLAADGGSNQALVAAMQAPGLELEAGHLQQLAGRSASCQLQLRELWLKRVGPLDRKEREQLAEAELWFWLRREYELEPPHGRGEEYLFAMALAESGRRSEALKRFSALPEGYRDTARWINWLKRVGSEVEEAGSGRMR